MFESVVTALAVWVVAAALVAPLLGRRLRVVAAPARPTEHPDR